MQKHEIKLPEKVIVECVQDYGEEIVFWGMWTDVVIILDKKSKQFEIRRLDTTSNLSSIIYIPIDSDEGQIVFSRDRQSWFRYLPEKREFEKHSLCIDSEDVRQVVGDTGEPVWKKLELDSDGTIHEGVVTLEYFIEKIV
jgi:hypothetical protein